MGVQSPQLEKARVLSQVEISRDEADSVPSHLKQEPKGGFPYLLWGMARWSAMPHGGRSTRWECSHRFIPFGLYVHFLFILSLGILISNNASLQFDGFTDRRHTKPNLKLVNKASLDKVLKAKIYVNEANGQLRATHLILGCAPLSFAFQAPKCVIRAHDPRLHRISVAFKGFVVPEGIPLPQDTSCTEPLFVADVSAGASSSQLTLREEEVEEREEEEEGEEEVVELSDSSDDFGIFDQSIHSEEDPDEMGIQRKPQRSLMELMEGQLGKSAPAKSTQSQTPSFPTRSPPSAPHQPSRQPP